VIYRINLRDPASFFAAQEFAIQDKDVIYVSNAPIADFQKFANMVSSLAFSFVTIGTSVP
jgi:polysaccharide export outer membrane protein